MRSGQNDTSMSRLAGDEHLLDHRGDARVHGAAQDEVLPVAELVEQTFDREPHELRVGVEVLVDRRADHAARRARPPTRPSGRSVASSRSVAMSRSSISSASRSENGILPARHPVDRVRVEVVERDRQAGVGEHQPERKPDVAAAADDHYVPRKRRAHVRLPMSRRPVLVGSPRRPALTLGEIGDLTSGFARPKGSRSAANPATPGSRGSGTACPGGATAPASAGRSA